MATNPELDRPSYIDGGFSDDEVLRMGRLGLVFAEARIEEIEGHLGTSVRFTFTRNTPLERAKFIAEFEPESQMILTECITDARQLDYDEFKAKYAELGPFED